VRDKHRDKTPCGPVKASPEKAAGKGCKDEHRISCGNMDRGVKKGRKDKSGLGAPSLIESALHKTSPEDFLSEPNGEKKQQSHEGRGQAPEVRVNRGDVSGTVRKERREEPGDDHEELVPQVEKGVQECGQDKSDEYVLGGELSARKERSSKQEGDGRKKRCAEGEHNPEVEGLNDEHNDPEQKSQTDARPESAFTFTDH